jgi:hypothetical protein
MRPLIAARRLETAHRSGGLTAAGQRRHGEHDAG